VKNQNLFNRKSLKFFRSSLRNKSTSAEAVLWNILKSKKLNSRKFRRQHSICNYIVDFFCASEKLVIELDGNQHGEYHKRRGNISGLISILYILFCTELSIYFTVFNSLS
jgi:very-short-patch-repair endonuclease